MAQHRKRRKATLADIFQSRQEPDIMQPPITAGPLRRKSRKPRGKAKLGNPFQGSRKR